MTIMSVVGRPAKNHPQQKASDVIDDRATTRDFFDPLDRIYRFTIDVAASADNTKCTRFYDLETDGLAQTWDGEVVWCNPPYSDIRPWVAKAWRSTAVVVMLLPANRTEQRWWQDLIEPWRDQGVGLSVSFLAGRLRFLHPGKTIVGPDERPPFGCCLAVWDGHQPTDLEPQLSLFERR